MMEGDFVPLEIIMSKLNKGDQSFLAFHLNEVFENHMSDAIIAWTTELLMSQSTETDPHSFVCGQTNTGFCGTMMEGFMMSIQSERYLARLFKPVREYVRDLRSKVEVCIHIHSKS